MRKITLKPKSKTPAKAPSRPVKRVIKKKKIPAQLPKETVGLHNLKPPRGAHKAKKLLGRGPSSGHGKTSTRGSKGQTSRAGRHFYLGFEGWTSPLIRRVPKRGFTSKFKKESQIVNLKDLSRIKETTINPQVLSNSGLIKDKGSLVKILGEGEIKGALTISAHAFSRRAAEEINKAGGKAEIIS